MSGGAADSFTNGTATVSDVGGLTFTFDEAGSEFVNEGVEVPSATASIMFVYSAVTWEQAKEAGVPADWMGADGNFQESAASEPWIIVKVERANGVKETKISDLTFKVNGQTVQIGGTFANGTTMNSNTKFMGLNLVTPENTEIHPDWLIDTQVAQGDRYEVSFQFNGETVTASGTYNGPAANTPTSASTGA